MAEEERPEPVKEVVRLPDGRRLIYYWFAPPPPRPRPPEEPGRAGGARPAGG